MSRIVFIVIALVLVAAIGLWVRAGIEPDEPGQAGPPTPHATDGPYENCLGCHGDITGSHDAMFGEGEYDDCLSCHPPQ
ncbi:hypothetical protein [Dethiobacter alkaliphilus]|uniref:Uncharacterized protein n=1 Tax=Dethiobacter alkaliphilus AHT 1 TaxID=555088 RepID=C0GK02_DETAL|nr:hypothetical protein [Dethiobacter alkaliphilus]EEG76371.1 hypothetical protein DealDRAFT_2811 [Dethiobacter alkaliphilus AHT 1]